MTPAALAELLGDQVFAVQRHASRTGSTTLWSLLVAAPAPDGRVLLTDVSAIVADTIGFATRTQFDRVCLVDPRWPANIEHPLFAIRYRLRRSLERPNLSLEIV